MNYIFKSLNTLTKNEKSIFACYSYTNMGIFHAQESHLNPRSPNECKPF